MNAKEREVAVPCEVCGKPTWSADAVCHVCAHGRPAKTERELDDGDVGWPHEWTEGSRCAACEYDLRGVPSDHACPECGHRGDPSAITIAGWHATTAPNPALVVLCVAMLVALVPLIVAGAIHGTTFDVLQGALVLIFFGPIALRTVLSYVRHRRGETDARLVLTDDRVELLGRQAISVPRLVLTRDHLEVTGGRSYSVDWSATRFPRLRVKKRGLLITMPWRLSDFFLYRREFLAPAKRIDALGLEAEIRRRHDTAQRALLRGE